ncbi:WXG100 family type VII secretion target [Streptomyces sp. TLI_171]|uniref:WXG100 family type VII secretion target n=1 Tax=Streptomyces sp. TLI_171 TaxID=1938859 RepID=UPI000C5C79C2|nr:hypothetical protein [Streptomyces sp. TLI_171]RKE17961.1 hypothetical protein BX266_1232 [Streptomyces sp. TLI_171]
MAVELPSGLNHILGLLGVRFPSANEDELNQLASQLEKFASALDSAQMTADRALTMLHEVYQGDSADRLAELWSTITKYSKVIVEICQTVAKVLRAAAVAVELAKTQSITQLFSIEAQLAAASSTGPWSTAAVLQMGRMVMNQLLEAAVSKLAQIVTKPIEDMIEKAADKVLPTPSHASTGQGFNIDLAQLASCAADLRRGADDIESHGTSFARIVQSLKMGDSGDRFGKIVVEAAQHILRTIAEDVLKRILSSFRETADKMDKLGGNLSDNEDSNRMSLNSIASTVANPFSPNSSLNSSLSTVGSPRTGGSSDAGLNAFAALMPKLGPVSSALSRGGRSGGPGAGVNTLGLKEPNLHAASGPGGLGGGSGPGGSPGAPGVHGAAGIGTRLAVPGSGGSTSSRSASRANVETDHQVSGGSGSSGSSSGGGTGTSTNSAGARPAGGMMGPMGMGMAHGYGPVGGSSIRGGGSSGSRNGRHLGPDEEDEAYSDGIVEEDPMLNMYAALQLGRVMPVRQEPREDGHRRDDRYDEDEPYDDPV